MTSSFSLTRRCALPAILLALIIVLTSGGLLPAQEQPKAADLVVDGQTIDLSQEKFRQLFAELIQQHQFTRQELDPLFRGLTINRKVLELMDKQWEAKPYHQYAPLFLTPETIAQGRDLLKKHKTLLDRIEAAYGVNRTVVVAIWGMETRYGSHQGSYEVFQTLNTLFDAYPRRSSFFRKQLIEYLLLCRENNMNPRGHLGSYAAAFGQPQFIPSSFRAYAVSFDGNSTADIFHSVPDILASIANYLKQSRFTLHAPLYAELGHELNDPQLVAAEKKGRKARVAADLVRRAQNRNLPPSPGNQPLTIVGLELAPGGAHAMRYVAGYPNFQAITEWNHSNRYAMAVSELAEAIGR